MLCQFTVKNYYCIKDEITLDMQAASITENEKTLLTDTDGETFLPLGVIYGPNGSGKSTVLRAIYSLVCKIMRPICAISCENKSCLRKEENVTTKPFLFSKETANAPTDYELFFRTDLYEYQYKLSVLKEKVLSESLYKKALTGARYTVVFKRKGSGNILLKGSLKNYNVKDVSENLTLISYFGITHKKNAIIKDIINWFDGKLYFINYSNPKEDALITVTEEGPIKEIILKMLAEMDIDISDYRVEDTDKKMKVITSHTVNEKKYELELNDESNGTIKIFGMLPFIAESILNGTTLLIDELDAKLHPVLLKYIINLFNDPMVNVKKAQLIFTSHDLSTMNSENFRRDEIWFIAKGKNLASKIYSLVEFKNDEGKLVRKDEKYNKRYLEGLYGADPYLRKIINWGNYNA